MSDEDAFTIWTEKYRPETFDEIIGHDEIVRRVRSLTEQENLPHLLFAGPPGVGKCVSGDTPVLTASGATRPIQDVYDSDVSSVLALDEHGEISEKNIEYVIEDTGSSTRVTTADGADITVTDDHPLLTLRGGVPTWCEASDLAEDDLIAAPDTYAVQDPKPFLPDYRVDDDTRRRVASLFGRVSNAEDDASYDEVAAALDESVDAVKDRFSFATDPSSAIRFFMERRDRWCRDFLDAYLDDAVIVDDAYYIPVTDDTAEPLTYLLQRHGIRCQADEDTLRIDGRDAEKLRTLMSRSLPSLEGEEARTVSLATDHLNTVLTTLGINSYEFSNDVRCAIENEETVGESLAQYIYNDVHEKARQRLQNAVQFLDQCEDILGDNAFTEPRVDLGASDDLKQSLLYGHINTFQELRRGDLLPSVHDAVDELRRLHEQGSSAYQDRLDEQSLAFATSNAIQSFNINASSIAALVDRTPVQVAYENGVQQGVRVARHLYAVANAVKRIVASRVYDKGFLESLELISYLADAQLTWDSVTSVEDRGDQTVYDLNVADTHNFVAGNVPLINHNTTMSLVIARELYGESWQQNFLELNASDERGIDVVREKVKNFARTQSLGDVPFKIIYLDEADALTSDAQQALRRTMESYTRSCRFILSCNYSSKIIDPIQSRCTVFRFRGLGEADVSDLIDRIAAAEGLTVTDDGRDALLYASDGDLRRLENMLQTSASVADTIDDNTVYSVASYTDPENVEEILEKAVSGDFAGAKDQLLKTMLGQGLSGPDIIKQFQREIWSLDVSDERKLEMIEACGEAEFRLIEGSDEHVQLDALLAVFADD